MAFRFGDPGGRMYNTAVMQTLPLWSATTGNNLYWSVVPGGGRATGSCLRLTVTAANTIRFLSVAVLANATWGIAFGFRSANAPSAAQPLFSLYDTGTLQCDIRLNTDYSLSVTRNGTILGTTAPVLTINTWSHIEWKTLIHPSAGTTEIRVNGVTVLTLSAQNTRNSANSSANTIAIGNVSATNQTNTALTFDWDDIIIWDGAATDAAGNPDIHDFIGDCGLVWLLPTGAGTTTQFTPDSGSNYTRVNEATPDGDTSYVEDATVGHIDTYTLADLPGTVGSVKSVALVSYARKTDFSSRGMKHELRTNSTNVAHTNEIALTNSYLYYMSTWGQNPTGTPANWTVADINALEIGRQVSS